MSISIIFNAIKYLSLLMIAVYSTKYLMKAGGDSVRVSVNRTTQEVVGELGQVSLIRLSVCIIDFKYQSSHISDYWQTLLNQFLMISQEEMDNIIQPPPGIVSAAGEASAPDDAVPQA